VLHETADDWPPEDQIDDKQKTAELDLRRVLAGYTIGYLEWPHIDGRFWRVFATMPGRLHWEWAGSEPEADGQQPDHRELHFARRIAGR
jgi:hypothetical protein